MIQDLILQIPALQSDNRLFGLSTDTKPVLATDGSPLDVGTEFIETDSGHYSYWDGAAWKQTTGVQKLYQATEMLIEIRNHLKSMAHS